MAVLYRILWIAIAATLAACNNPDTPSDPPPVKDTFAGDLAGTLDKAKAVQGTVDEHKRDIDRQLDADEGATEEKP